MYQKILQSVQDDFLQMEAQVFGRLDSKVRLIMQVSAHIMGAGGKKMRPLLAILVARALLDGKEMAMDKVQTLGAICEMLHTATLVHDDVIDGSSLRRGKPTANAAWDNATAVLVGDYLIARSFNLLVDFNDLALLKLFSDGTCAIAEGEVLQLAHKHDIHTTPQDYFAIIKGKTSMLFMMAVEGTARLIGAEYARTDLARFGLHFGNAFQLIDDALDFVGDVASLGKNIGDDLAEGKPTLPIIYALDWAQQHDSDGYQNLRIAVQTGQGDVVKLMALIQRAGAIDKCMALAKQEGALAIDALQGLPDNQYKRSLIDLVKLSLSRLS